MSVVAALIVVFSAIAFVGSLVDRNPNGEANTGVTGQAPKSQVVSVKSDFPPLHFSSSQRLPTKLHRFQLGMSVADALSMDSEIENLGNSDVKPSPADAEASLRDRLADGYSVWMSFSRGRLIWISSEVGNISPEDASAFDKDTLRQLGKPTFNVYQGSDQENWVWVDGDVRLRYVNRPYGNSYRPTAPRIVSLDMCIYPETQKKNSTSVDLGYEWGDTSAPVIRRALPHGIGGLRLREQPWEIRLAAPGIDITTISENEAKGELQSGDYLLEVSFWQGHVKSFCEYFSNYEFQRYIAVRDQSLKLWGTPARRFNALQPAGTEIITWDDGRTGINYSWVKAAASFTRCWTDIELARPSDEGEQQQYKTAPPTRSFF